VGRDVVVDGAEAAYVGGEDSTTGETNLGEHPIQLKAAWADEGATEAFFLASRRFAD
jgi:hypothetical protein